MVDVGIKDGDLIVIRRQKHVNDGDIIALFKRETTYNRIFLFTVLKIFLFAR